MVRGSRGSTLGRIPTQSDPRGKPRNITDVHVLGSLTFFSVERMRGVLNIEVHLLEIKIHHNILQRGIHNVLSL